MKYWPLVSVLVLMFLVSGVLAVEYIAHDVTVLIPYSGDIRITEVYQVKLNSTEKTTWENILSNATVNDLISLGTGPSFTVPIKDYHVSYVMGSGGFAQITLQYTTDSLLHKVEDKGTSEVLELVGADTVFQKDGKFELPLRPATQLTIQFPRGYKLADIPQPNPTEQRVIAQLPGYLGEFYEYTWRGPLSSEGFKLVFERDKPIQTQFSLQGLIEDLKYRFGNPLYAAAAVIVIVLAFWYRKQIIELLKEAFAEEPVIEEEEEE